MTRGSRIAITVLSVLLAGVIALLVWLYVSDRAAAAEWALRDQERVAEMMQRRKERDEWKALAEQYQAATDAAEADAEDKAKELAALRAKYVKVKKSVPQEAQDLIAAQAKQIDLKDAGLRACKTTVLSLNKALGKSEAADLLNENRADNWREYSRKQQRRGRIKLAFTAIGAATVGGLAGYGVGVSR